MWDTPKGFDAIYMYTLPYLNMICMYINKLLLLEHVRRIVHCMHAIVFNHIMNLAITKQRNNEHIVCLRDVATMALKSVSCANHKRCATIARQRCTVEHETP